MERGMNVHPVVLCGGSGTRLWPLSREGFPKQFVPLVNGRSLLQGTLERVKPFGTDVLCVANHEHRFLVQEAMDSADVAGRLLLEPAGRNTAAAMTSAALNCERHDLLLFLPSDHYIPCVAEFAATVRAGVAAAEERYLVTFGVVPTHPATGYGYIQRGATIADEAFKVAKFVEKPNGATAQQLLLAGGHLWNAGIFLTRADVLLAGVREHAPDILAACEQAASDGRRDGPFIHPEKTAFLDCRSISIDYAVMEKHARVAVVPFGGVWSDVGNWNAVAELTLADDSGNRVVGRGSAIHSVRTYIHAQERPVVALGAEDLLIVDTTDALLVAHRSRAEEVKDAVALLKQRRVPEAVSHRKVHRPSGWYDSIALGERFQVKRITVKPGASLSLQMHHHRAEHWIVVRGTAQVTRDDETFLVAENESTYIPLGAKHRLVNPGKMPLEMIEVQSGSYLGEDDIVRVEDAYGRN
jgi:mannose-1-phosphate guanylyltransferase/mannose-6-phosphate isomerase